MSEPVQKSRSGSQRRQASEQIKINCTGEQKEKLLAIAQAHGQSPAALCLKTLLGLPLPRVRMPRLNEGLFAKALARLAALTAELNKHGSNLNQLTHYINAERPVSTLERALAACLDREEELQREVLELRALFMQAMDGERLPRNDDQT
jgi:hypothetical protein